MNNKKAFTLVELLGVIILLGIIGIIITPNILKIQKNAAKNSFENSVNALIRAAQLYHANNDFINYPSSGIAANSELLNVKNNETMINGTIKLTNNEFYYADSISNGAFCASGYKNDLYISSGECPETPISCFDFDEETKTVTKFNRKKLGCETLFPSIPDRINDIPVENIGFAAFTDPKLITCSNDNWASEYNTPLDYNPTPDEQCRIEVSESFEPLVGIKLPIHLKKIEQSAFSNNSLVNVDFTGLKQLEQIEYRSFFGNDIRYLDFTNNKKLLKIGDKSFEKNNKLLGVIIKDLPLLTYIGKNSFSYIGEASIELVNLPNLTQIGDGAFKESLATSAKFINLPKIEEISYEMFFNSNLAKLTIEGMPNLRIIKDYSFAYNNIENIELQNLDSLHTIGKHSFRNNISTNITLKNLKSLVKIDEYAFQKASANKVEIDNLPLIEEIGNHAFRDGGFNLLIMNNMPKLNRIGEMAFHCSFVYSSSNLDLSGLSNLSIISGWSFSWNNFGEIKLPTSTTFIGENTLRGYGRLSSVNLNELNNLTTIGANGLYLNSLVNLVVPEKVDTIGTNAFTTNTSYKSIKIMGTNCRRFNSIWTSIGFPSSLKPSILYPCSKYQ